NGGPSTEPAGVVITDPIPAGTTGSETEADCTLGANFVCTTTVALAPGASVIYHLTRAVAPRYAAGSLAHTATISTSVNDSNTANDHDTDTDTVSKSSDLSITKDDGVGSVVAATSTTYAITLTNGGPSTEPAGVAITDPIPAGTTGSETEADCTLGANFVCTTTVALAPGASVIYHLT